MTIQKKFVAILRFERGLLACDEVTSYGGIADVLAVDKNKKIIIEYEFKASSYDLKVAEKKKSKYSQHKSHYQGKWIYTEKPGKNKYISIVSKDHQRPHKFYFVVPIALYEKEKEYLSTMNCGVIAWREYESGKSIKTDFIVMKHCIVRKSNLQKYDVVVMNILARVTSAYAALLPLSTKNT